VKVESVRALGAEAVFYGRDFDEAREYAQKQATGHRYRYIHSGNEPSLIAGVATCALEILQGRPDIEVIVVPVGGGSGAAGACVAAKAVRFSVEVIGVQSEAAPAAYRSWRAGSLSRTPPARSRMGWPPGPRSSCRSRSCGSCWMTSCWSLRMR
jgi:threonine dehydratase